MPPCRWRNVALDLRRAELGYDPCRNAAVDARRSCEATSNTGDPAGALAILEETEPPAARTPRRRFPGAGGDAARNCGRSVRRIAGTPQAALAAQLEAFEILSQLPPTHDQYRFLRAGEEPDRQTRWMRRAITKPPSRPTRNPWRCSRAPARRRTRSVGAALHNIGLSMRALGRLQEALPYLERALAHTRRTIGEDTIDFETSGIDARARARAAGQLRGGGTLRAARVCRSAERLYGTEHQILRVQPRQPGARCGSCRVATADALQCTWTRRSRRIAPTYVLTTTASWQRRKSGAPNRCSKRAASRRRPDRGRAAATARGPGARTQRRGGRAQRAGSRATG